jgi:hypothetical protein
MRGYNVSRFEVKKVIPDGIHVAFFAGLGLVSGQNSLRRVL